MHSLPGGIPRTSPHNDHTVEPITFSVRGVPVTQGSKIAGVNRHTGRAYLKEYGGERLAFWRLSIEHAATEAMASRPVLTGPVRLEAVFWLPRPKSEPRRRRTWPIRARSGDLDKFLRALGDACSGTVIADDCQIVEARVRKDWALAPDTLGPGVDVVITEVS